MSDNLRQVAILLWSADLSAPHRVATPFVMAQAAAALDQQVELYFTAQTVHLLTPRVASVEVGYGPQQRPLGAYLKDAHELGVHFYACSQAMYAAGLTRHDLVPECGGMGGAVQFMERAADPAWRTLVF